MDAEFAVIEFNALVQNVTGNQSGTNRDNTFTVLVNGVQSGPASTTARVQVVEPVITDLAKVVNTVESVSADAGDTVTFRSRFSNSGNASAFDVVYTDALPAADLTLDTGSVVVLRNGNPVLTGVTISTTGNTVTVTLDEVIPTDQIEIRYDATLTGSVAPNQVITTTGRVDYTGLPGAGTAAGQPGNATGQTTPGASGAADGERNGQDGVPTNGPLTTPLNNYRDTDPATIAVPNGNVAKTLFTTDLVQTTGSNVAVGETVTYRITVTLPEGRTTGLRVVDNLPPGMIYVPGSATFITTGFGGSFDDLAGTIVQPRPNSGDDVVFTFFGINVTGDNNTGNNSFVIELQAVVTNEGANEGVLPGQTGLPNTGTLQIGGGPVVNIPAVPATVVEPQLQVVKSVVNADTSIDAGTTVNYQVVITHTGNSTGPAFDLAVADLLSAIGMDLVEGSVIVSNPGYGTQTVTVGNTNGDTNVSIAVSELRLGDTITITYSAVLNGAAASGPAPGSTVTNTAAVDYDTFPGEANPQERQEPRISDTAMVTVNTYSVAGNIYRDLNNNGVYEPGAGETLIVENIALTLTGVDHQGNPVNITLTATDGTYNFTGLRPSNGAGYTVTQVTQPTGLLDGRDTPGTPFGGVGTLATDDRGTPQVPGRDADLISAVFIPLNAAQNGTANVGMNYNFGELPAATLGDFVFEDFNGNGVQDAGDLGINGVTVRLTGTDDTGRPVDVTTTTMAVLGVDGKYQFGNLRPSDGTGYAVTFTAPTGTDYLLTVPNSAVPGATDANDSDAVPQGGTTGTTAPYVIVAGQSQQSVDAGMYLPVTIGDTVFFDINGDGVQQAAAADLPEPGIPGVLVTLLYAGPDGDFGTTADNDSFTTPTDGNGNYSFSRIPGVYKAQVDTVTVANGGTLPNGLTATTPTTQATTPTLLASGSTDNDRDFGFDGTGSLGDRVFLDSNGDGVQGAPLLEPGLPLVGVTLTYAGQDGIFGTPDDFFTTTTTAASVDPTAEGKYTFPNLPTGNFRVTVNTTTLPGNVAPTVDLDGVVLTPNQADRSLADGENATNVDFGYVGNASLGDRVYIDQNGDGVQQSGEVGIPGAVVRLTWAGPDGTLDTADDVVYETTTTANPQGGNYLFPGLAVNGVTDEYRVEVVSLPVPGFVLTDSIDDGILDPTNPVVVPLAASQDRDDVDFGYDGGLGVQTISGTVYNDLNNDGIIQAGEPGIPGATIRLTGTDIFGRPVVDPATNLPYFEQVTDANGDYTFDTVVPGTYTLTEFQPANYNDGRDAVGTVGGTPNGSVGNDVIAGIRITDGDQGFDYDFGERGTVLAGTVFRDDNRDGAVTGTESGIPGVALALLDAAGNPVDDPNQPGVQDYVVVTGPDGKYRFENIPAGDYKVVETQPAGYANSPVGPTTIRTATVPLAGLGGQDFGEILGSLSGFVYVDANNNGVFNPGESPIPNVPVTLTGTDAQGNTINRTVVTGADGKYVFESLFPADGAGYAISEGATPPYTDGLPNVAGTAGGTSAGPNAFDAITLDAGQVGTTYNFGERLPAAPFINGSVYIDANRNGTRQTGEVGIPGVTVTLLDAGPDGKLGTADDGAPRTAVTGANGDYSFPNLVTGRTYQVVETQPGTFGDSPAGPARLITVPTLPTSGSTGNNFGEVLGSLAGSVYFDSNKSGTRDPGETGIPGVMVTLTGTDVDGTAVARTATTGAGGKYVFADLPAGTYTVSEPTQPVGYVDGRESVGTAGGLVGDDEFTQVSIGGGVDATRYDFGEVGVPVSGTVFFDQNRDGTQQGGTDTGIPGVTVELVDANGVVVGTTTTGPDGSYAFPNVPPGTYSVREVQPLGYGDSTPDTLPVTVAGTPVTGVDFGDTLSTVSGSVYVDANQNGVRDGGEPGLGGVVVTLIGTDAAGVPVSKVTTTDANGNYAFIGLFASDQTGYTVTEPTQPAGYEDGSEVYGPSGLVIAGSAGGPDVIASLAVPAGADVPGNTFGEIVALAPGTGGISGTVYLDRDANGQLDAGEAPLLGVTVTLTDGVNPPLVVTTDANGNYLFTNLPPGIYTVTETQPTGLGSTTPNVLAGITVVANQVNGGNNFSEDAGSIRGTVFADANNDGVQNGTDIGLSGVTLTLQDGTGAAVVNPLTGQPYTTTADAFGNYTFADLVAGDYQVVETQPAGYTSGINTVGSENGTATGDTFALTLPVATDATAYDYAELLSPTGVPVSGTVFQDRDRDGTLDLGEPGIPGVLVELIDAGGNVVASTTTGPDGSYLFPNVTPGTYTVRETQPVGYGNPDAGPFAPNTRPITVATTPITDQNFGDTLGSLSGSVYLDANRNDTRDTGEPGLSGVQVVLTGTTTGGAPVTRTTTTGPGGTYTFPDLPAGTYTVTELQPTGYFDGADRLGTVNGTPTGTAGNDVFTNVTLPAGRDGINYIFGEQPPTAPVLGTTFVAGTVFVDPNGNGVLNAGEVGIPGVTVELRNAGGVVVQTTTTGPGGGYLFTDVPPGTYTVVEPTDPTGFGSTSPNSLPITVPATLVPVTNVNFGEAQARVSGTVFLDSNNNGTQDAGEPGIGGVAVTLAGTDAQGNPVSRPTTTGADGKYVFTALPPSDAAGYTITETQPVIYADGTDTSGTVNGTPIGSAGNDVVSGVVLPPASAGTGYNFGELPPQSGTGTTFVAGTVFLDGNRDGTLTGGETGLGGVTVELVDANGNVVGTAPTNPDGSYLFNNVTPGTFTVRETQPGAFGSSSPNTLPVIVPASLVPVTGVNFGETLGSIAGSVYNDLNGNGVRDAGEPGIPMVSVTLAGTDVNGNQVAASATTNADGEYVFPGLPAGSYTVTEPTQPAGYADGLESVGTAGGVTPQLDTIMTVPLGGGVQSTGYDFGELGVNSLSGFVYLDFDLNAARTTGPGTPDRPIPGALVLLTGTDLAGNPITRSAITDADGFYEFTDLPAGSYRITENQDALPTTALPADGVYDGAETIGSVGGSLPAGPQGNVIAVALTGDSAATAQTGVNYNFGELPPADPFGFVFEDRNNNGVREPGEPGIAGVPITLSGTAFFGTPFARPLTPADTPTGSLTVFTDANGFYEFNPIPPGLYTLTQAAQPAGFLDGLEENADPNGPFTVVVGNDRFSNIELEPSPVRGPFNFGEIRPASIAGTVYLDANRNGVRDAGEAGIGGVGITLTGTDDRGNPVSVAGSTDAAGNFVFSGLRPGTYNIAESQPADLGQGSNAVGSAGGLLVATDVFGQINLGPGAVATGYLFGEVVIPPVDPASPVVPTPVPPLPPLPPFVSIAPGAELSKRTFLASTDGVTSARVATERTAPDFDALGSVSDTRLPQFISTAEGVGGELVRVFDLTGGQERFRFRPFPGNPGGVRVATADVTGDQIPDIITAAGPGGGPRVVVFDGNNGSVIADFMAFEESFTGGLFVATGDFDGDGRADVVVTPDVGGGPRVRVFGGGDPGRVLADFMGIDDPAFRGGARAAVGDVDGDGTPDIVVGAGVGGGPRVAVWDGAALLGGRYERLTPDFFAFESSLRNGVYLAVGDVDGDGFGDVIAGAGPGGAPRVVAFAGATLLTGQPDMIADFFAGDPADRGGVPVAAVDLDGDGRTEVFTGAGEGSLPVARFIDPRTVRVIDAFAAEYFEFLGGIDIG